MYLRYLLRLKYPIWEKEEAEKQKQDPRYVHPDLKEFKEYCWIRRIGGHWFMNNNKPTYITGTHWFYLSCYHLDIGLPKYRDVDREFFYSWEYSVQDPNCFGLVETTKRRSGKTHQDFFAGRVTDYSKSTADWSDL